MNSETSQATITPFLHGLFKLHTKQWMIEATTIFGSFFATTFIAILVGVVVVAVQQCRHQKRIAGEFQGKTRNIGFRPSPSKVEPLLGENIREMHESIQLKHRQSLEALSQELKNMKKIQRDVKDQLEGLRRVVEEASKKKNMIAPS